MDMINHCIPLKVVALHYCYGSKRSAFDLILPTIKQVMGPNLRRRLRLHIGEDKEIMADLKDYGIEHVHKSVGGNVEFDESWVDDRIRLEIIEKKSNDKYVKPPPRMKASTRKPRFSRAA
jgi:hypothetical protein